MRDDSKEADVMKPISIILSFALLFAGCYSHTLVTKEDSSNLDDETLTFYLTDGTYITSKAGNHRRIENGHEVTGEHVSKKYYNSSQNVSVVLHDDQISRVETNQLNVGKTVVVLGLAGLLFVGIIVGLNAFGEETSGIGGLH
jgi:hypothetical protein